MSTPIISVIMSVYNVEKYIRKSIESILNQTFCDIELILVDDGSPDNCPQICDEYAARDNRIRVIHKENAGLAKARNDAIAISAGAYLMFADSDDWVHPNWCAHMLSEIKRYPDSLIVCDTERPEENPAVATFDVIEKTHSVEISYLELYKMGLSPYAWNKIYVTEIVKSNGLTFDSNSICSEDVSFVVNYCRLCKACRYLPEKLYYYYSNPESIMHQYYPQLFENHIGAFRARLPLFDEEELVEYCDEWLYRFICLFGNVFDERNSISFIQKLRYNQRMLNSNEVQYCLAHASGRNENPIVISLMKSGNYYGIWVFDKLAKLKHRFGGK